MNEPTKIYVVTQGEYSDCRNIGVFTTREKAEAAGGDHVEEWLLDNRTNAPGHYGRFFIVMDREGNVRRLKQDSFCGEEQEPEPGPTHFKDEVGCWWFHEWGTDLIHAIKVANEKRAQLIAEGKWN